MMNTTSSNNSTINLLRGVLVRSIEFLSKIAFPMRGKASTSRAISRNLNAPGKLRNEASVNPKKLIDTKIMKKYAHIGFLNKHMR